MASIDISPVATRADTSRPATVKPKSGRDDYLMLFFVCLIGLYLIVSLALPLAMMLWKSLEVRTFDYKAVELQVDTGQGFQPLSLSENGSSLGLTDPISQARRSTSLTAAQLFRGGKLDGNPVTAVRMRYTGAPGTGVLELAGKAVSPGEWAQVEAKDLRRLVLRAGTVRSLENFRTYFSTPALSRSIGNTLFVGIATTVITVFLAFWYAYALHRTCMPFKGIFRMLAMIPILVPSLLGGLSLVYLFGNQGLLKPLMMGNSIYGAQGIIAGSVFFTFPHAFLVISTALAIADARLFEAARALRTSAPRTFMRITLPGAQYGLISALFVVFTLTITDFGVPKVVGGDYSVLAVDIYKQVVGQQNFGMGAVVSVLLLLPAALAFFVDRVITRRQVALLSARAVPYEPKPHATADGLGLLYCCIIGGLLLGVLAVAQYASLIQFWPYNHTLTLKHYSFEGVDGGGWFSYFNSLWMSLLVAVIGTAVVFVGAYLVDKGRGFAWARSGFQLLAMLPMAIPGLVLGLSYIFFFNWKENPLHFIYGTMAILVICTITHFYTVSHLTALTALKAMDREFEAVASSLKQPVTKMFTHVTVPVCMPTMLDIAAYFFVNAMTTVSAVVFIYAPTTTLAAVAALNMDDAGQIQAAAAMCMLIFYTNLAARGVHGLLGRVLSKTQAWRYR